MCVLADWSCRYLLFASFFISVKSVQYELADGQFKITDLFTNTLFLGLIVSTLSTYVLYLLVSILFLDPWHMFTSVSQSSSPLRPLPTLSANKL